MRRRLLTTSRRGMRALVALALVGVTATAGSAGSTAFIPRAHAAGCPWMNASQSPDQRARELLGAMTLADKIAMVHGAGTGASNYGAAGSIPGNSALCLPALYLNDAGQGVGDQQTNTTAFPAPIAQASSWDTNLEFQLGQAIGREAHLKGVNIQLAPDVNIARVPMNGRNFEAFGEDPFLSGQAAAAFVNGIQSAHVIATVKHYDANNQETNRNTVSEDVAERTIHEIYLPAFETAVKQGHAGAVMCAYNKVNSIYSCENPILLTSDLKHEFGFQGFVMSDWSATHSTVAAANAGLDMEMPDGTYFGAPLQTAVQNGQVPMSRLNDMVFRILRSMFAVGLFDDPAGAEPDAFAANAETPDDNAVARIASEEGTVLLRNAGNVLPLTAENQRIAVIGTQAGPDGAQETYNGGGSAHIPEFGNKADVVSPLQGIQQRALTNLDTVTYADGSDLADAIATAKAANVAIVFAGQEDSEGVDRANLALSNTFCEFTCVTAPTDPNQLIEQVAAANPNTIVVLNTGGPVLMPWINQVKGVLEAWYPGQQDGNAIAALLFGDANPSGKLPETFPRSQNDLPTRTVQQYPGVNLHALYSEGLDVGYRWYDARGIQPLFPFGFGLSYTTFKYSGLRLYYQPGGTILDVTFTITNTGQRAGAEVAQVYVGDPSAAGEPPKQLKGFARVYLAPGQSRQVTVTLDPRALAYWTTASHQWTIAAGAYRIMVGASSRDVRLAGTVTHVAENLGP